MYPGKGCLHISVLTVLAVLLSAGRAARAETVLFVADETHAVIWVLDAATGVAARGFPVPAEAMARTLTPASSGLAYDGSTLYYTRSTSRRIWFLDPVSGQTRGEVLKPKAESVALGVAAEGLLLVESATRRGTLLTLDPRSGRELRRREIPGLRQAAGADSRGSLYLLVGSLEVREISSPGGATRRSFAPPVPLLGIAHAGNPAVLHGLAEDGSITLLDPSTGKAIGGYAVADPAGNPLPAPSALAAGEGTLQSDRRITLAPGPEALFEIQETAITAGTVAQVPILLTAAAPVLGFSLAFIHDPGQLFLEHLTIDGTDTAAARADYHGVEVLPNGGTLSVMLDLSAPFEGNVLPAGEDRVIARCAYRPVADDLQSPVVTEVRFADLVVGSPPKQNLVAFPEREVTPHLSSGKITCLPRAILPGGPEFQCGGRPAIPGGPPAPLSARSGERVELCFFYSFPQPEGPIQGLSMALVHDCRLTCLENQFRVPPGSITALVGADFVEFHCENNSEDGDGCEMVLGILVDSLPPFGGEALPPTLSPLLLACVDLEIGSGMEVNECLEVHFRDGINGDGVVPMKNLVSVENQSVPAALFPCEVCVTAVGPSLYCGAGTLNAAGMPESVPGMPGDEVEFFFWYSSPGQQVSGLTQALRFDCRLECLESSFRPSPELALAGILQPGRVTFQCENNPDDGDGCEMVLRFASDPSRPLPATNRPLRLGSVRLRIADDAPRGPCLVTEYHDGASARPGQPANNEIILGTTPVSPQTFDCRVCVTPAEPPRFFCGGPALGPDGLPVPLPEVERGERFDLCFWYTSPVDEMGDTDEIQGLSIAMCYDCNLTCIESSFDVPPDSITAQIGAEFVSFDCDNNPRDGDGCELIVGILVDVRPPFDGRTLPPTDTPLKLACVEMEVGPGGKPGFCLDVKFCDGADGEGQVPIKNVVSVKSFSVPVETSNCQACLKHLGPKFFCGAGELGPDGLPRIPEGKSGSRVELCFWYCAPEDNATTHAQLDHLQGLSMALTYDCRLECLEDTFRVPPDSILAAIHADFVSFQCEGDTTDGDGCEMVLAILVDSLPPFDGGTLPPTAVPLKLACVDMVLPEDAACDDCFPIRFQNGINGRGKVPVFNLVAVENQSFLAITNDCQMCVNATADPVFQRGDCNFDGSVDVADPVEIVSALFAIGTWRPTPVCPDACDANDDGRFDLADAWSILLFLYRLGPAPPPPGPLAPGPDPTPDKIGCETDPCP